MGSDKVDGNLSRAVLLNNRSFGDKTTLKMIQIQTELLKGNKNAKTIYREVG